MNHFSLLTRPGKASRQRRTRPFSQPMPVFNSSIQRNRIPLSKRARRKTSQDSAKLPPGTQFFTDRGSSARSSKITPTAKRIDNALEAVAMENPNGAERHKLPARGVRRGRARARIKRKNVLNKNHIQLQNDLANIAGLTSAQPFGDAGLFDLIATVPFQHAGEKWLRQNTAATNSNGIAFPFF